MNGPREGMIVYGVLKFRGGKFNSWIPGAYKGVITEVTEEGFRVKYDVLRSDMPYKHHSWNKMVFPDQNTCEYEADKVENPEFRLHPKKKEDPDV